MWDLDWYARLDKSGEEMLRWELVNGFLLDGLLFYVYATFNLSRSLCFSLFICHLQSCTSMCFEYVSFQFWFSSCRSCFPSDHLLGRTRIKTPWSISWVSRLWNRESKWNSTLRFFAEFLNLVFLETFVSMIWRSLKWVGSLIRKDDTLTYFWHTAPWTLLPWRV